MSLPAGLSSRFEHLSELGRGSFGLVLRVRDRRDGQVRALKLLETGGDDRRARREIETALSVRHEHLLRSFDGGVEGPVAWLVSELAESSLDRLLAPPLDPERRRLAWEALLGAASGVLALEASGLVHRDLKPQNILLVGGKARVADFGLVRGTDHRTLTQQGIVLGTLEYLSPEQARGEKLTPASDLYSLGVMFFQVVEGRLPYPPGLSPGDLMVRIARGLTLPLEAAPGILPAECVAILASLLAPRPEDRPPPASKWLPALETARPNFPADGVVGGSRTRALSGRVASSPVEVGSVTSLSQARMAMTRSRAGAPPPGVRPGTGSRTRPGVFGALLGLGLVLATALLGIRTWWGSPFSGLELDSVGDAVRVRFRARRSGTVRLFSGDRGIERTVSADQPAELVLGGLPSGIPSPIHLSLEGSAILAGTVEAGLPGIESVELGSGHRIRIGLRRRIRVWTEDRVDDVREGGPGRVELPVGRDPLGGIAIQWEEDGIRSIHPVSPEDLIVTSIRTLERDLDSMGGEREILNRLSPARWQGILTGGHPETDEKLDLLRTMWSPLERRIAAVLSSRAPREARLALWRRWRTWSTLLWADSQLIRIGSSMMAAYFPQQHEERLARALAAHGPIADAVPELVPDGLASGPASGDIVLLSAPAPSQSSTPERLALAFEYQQIHDRRTPDPVPRVRFRWPEGIPRDGRPVFVSAMCRGLAWFQYVFRPEDPSENSAGFVLAEPSLDTVSSLSSWTTRLRDPQVYFTSLPADLAPPGGTPMVVVLEPLSAAQSEASSLREVRISWPSGETAPDWDPERGFTDPDSGEASPSP